MSDRELLEAAAKAVGLPNLRFKRGKVFYSHAPQYGHIVWNPLEDDGDALRLAVALDMDLCIESAVGHTRADEVYVDHGGDQEAATRRAIVLAAAERQ